MNEQVSFLEVPNRRQAIVFWRKHIRRRELNMWSAVSVSTPGFAGSNLHDLGGLKVCRGGTLGG